mmetsp:Transcript_39687/g.118098  ORF Transcript_39687/g.118098 Transcript_39687/m.118098 type:complete len:248 (+) Transcript_39687:1260-2003(+)
MVHAGGMTRSASYMRLSCSALAGGLCFRHCTGIVCHCTFGCGLGRLGRGFLGCSLRWHICVSLWCSLFGCGPLCLLGWRRLITGAVLCRSVTLRCTAGLACRPSLLGGWPPLRRRRLARRGWPHPARRLGRARRDHQLLVRHAVRDRVAVEAGREVLDLQRLLAKCVQVAALESHLHVVQRGEPRASTAVPRLGHLAGAGVLSDDEQVGLARDGARDAAAERLHQPLHAILAHVEADATADLWKDTR